MKTLLSLISILLLFSFLPQQSVPNEEVQKQLETYQKLYPLEKIYVHTDRPQYELGEDIWFKAYLTDIGNRASEISEIVYVELLDPKGSSVQKHQIVAINGFAAGDFKISPSAAGGLYTLKAWTRWGQNFGEDNVFEKEINIQANVLPRLLMKLDFEEKAYGANDKVTAKLKLNTLTNEPLAKYPYSFKASLDGNILLESNGTTDEKGKALVQFKLPKNLTTNDGLLNILINHEGQTESISRSIPIVLNDIDLQFFPEGGTLVGDIQSSVAFKALNEFGKAADIKGIILEKNGEEVANFESFHNGMGIFDFTPKAGKKYIAKITRPEGIEKAYNLPETTKGLWVMNVNNETQDVLNIEVNSTQTTQASLFVQMNGQFVHNEKINLQAGENTFELSTKKFSVGIAQVSLFDSQNIPQTERLVFINKERELLVNIETDKEEYLPREKVNVNISVQDDSEQPVQGNFSMAVVDDKLLSFADDKQDHIRSYLLMNSELKGKVEEPSFYFDRKEEKADKALDLVMMTHGWRAFEWEKILETDANLKMAFEPEKAIIKGKVLNTGTDTPLANVEVCLLETGEITFTNELGHFEFQGVDLSIPTTIKANIDEKHSRVYSVNEYVPELSVGQRFKGKIIDEDTRETLAFANVIIEGTNKGTTTDIDGIFELIDSVGITSKNPVLVVTYVGYQTMRYEPKGDEEFIEIKMSDGGMILDEVVVTSGGRRRRGGFKQKKMRAAKGALPPPPVVMEEVMEEGFAEEEKAEAANGWMADADGIVPPPMAPPPPPALEIVEDEEMIMEEMEIEMDVDIEEVVEEIVEDKAFFAANKNAKMKENEIYAIVEEMPEFPGGQEKMLDFIYSNIKYPHLAQEKKIEGRCIVSFMVQPDGTVDNIRVVRDIGGGCGEEARNMIEKMPKWKAGKQRGQAVPVRYNLPVMFSLDNEQIQKNEVYIQFAKDNLNTLKEKPALYYKARKFYSPKYETTETDIRNDFRKTVYWNPNIVLNQQGKATVSFYNSDEVTQFRITLEGLAGGKVAHEEKAYFTRLPFSLDAKMPTYLTFEDKLHLPIILKNNTDKPIKGKLWINAPDAAKSTNEIPRKITIEPNSVYKQMASYDILSKAGDVNFGIHFESRGLEDAIQQNITIVPKGFPIVKSFSSDKINAECEIDIRDLIDGSLTARFAAYPNMVDEIMDGLEGLLREPRGCFEQTSSSTYPNILALQYMEVTETIRPDVKKKALDYIEKGYKRLVGFETAEHGFEWFGKTPPHEGLTAYGLMEFVDMQKVYDGVDKKMIKRTADWLLSRRDGKGGFNRSSKALDQFGRADDDIQQAYIVYAFSEAGYSLNDLKKEFEVAYKTALKSKDAYRMGLIANAAYNFKQVNKGNELMNALSDLVAKKSFGELPAKHSITYSGGRALQIEATALMILANLQSPKPDRKFLKEAVAYLLSTRSRGRFASTQSTILALKALTEFTEFAKSTDEGGTIQILVNGEKVQEHTYEKGTQGEIKLTDWAKNLGKGNNKIAVKYVDSKKAIPYTIDVEWNTNTPDSQEACAVKVSTDLASASTNVGETIRLKTTIENTTAKGLATLIAKIGIPSGLSPQPWQLKELVEKEKVAFYEIWDNYLVLYWRDMAPNATYEINLDLKAEVPGTYQSPASSTYLYYTDEYKHWIAGTNIEIN